MAPGFIFLLVEPKDLGDLVVITGVAGFWTSTTKAANVIFNSLLTTKV